MARARSSHAGRQVSRPSSTFPRCSLEPELQRTLYIAAPVCPSFTQVDRGFANAGPKLAKAGPILPEVGQYPASICPSRLDCDQSWRCVDRVWPKFGQHRDKTGPTTTKIRSLRLRFAWKPFRSCKQGVHKNEIFDRIEKVSGPKLWNISGKTS